MIFDCSRSAQLRFPRMSVPRLSGIRSADGLAPALHVAWPVSVQARLHACGDRCREGELARWLRWEVSHQHLRHTETATMIASSGNTTRKALSSSLSKFQRQDIPSPRIRHHKCYVSQDLSVSRGGISASSPMRHRILVQAALWGSWPPAPPESL